jgi:hypothetical protein
MSSEDDKSLETLGLSAEERARLEAEEKKRLLALANDVSRRYDPARLGKLAIAGAGRAEKLDDETRRRMEARLGGSFGDVRVVRGPFADRVTKRHGADAVTIGATGLILLRDTPRTNMKSPEGRAVLAHELTHVRQAQRGMHFALEQGSSGHAHEQEAERVERTILRDEKTGAGTAGLRPTAKQSSEQRRWRVIQRVLERWEEEQRDELDRHGYDHR